MNIQNINTVPVSSRNITNHGAVSYKGINYVPVNKSNKCTYIDLNECPDVQNVIETSKNPVVLIENKPLMQIKHRPVFLFNTADGIKAVAVSGLEDALYATGYPVDDIGQLIEKGLVKLPKEHSFKKPSTLIQY